MSESPPTASNSTTGSQRKRGLFAWTVGLLVATAIVLDIAALLMAAWVKEHEGRVLTGYPSALWNGYTTAQYSLADLEPGSSTVKAVYSGMRAGPFHICYTLDNTERCFSYHSGTLRMTLHVYSSEVYVNPSIDSMCDVADGNAGTSFEGIGIPTNAIPDLLDSFCGTQGYISAILPIGGLVAAVIAGVAWLASAGTAANHVQWLTMAMLASCVGATLSLASFVLWIGAFTGDSVSMSTSTHCTIAAVAVLAVAAVEAKRHAKELVAEAPLMDPLV